MTGVPALKKSKVLTWCFSVGKMMKGCWQQCFSNGRKMKRLLIRVFQQQKGRGETSAGRSCFVDENGDENGGLECFGSGKK
jgi:hypothetical protein